MKKKSLKANTILNMFRMFLTVLMPLITFPYTSRIFLTEGSGQLNFSSSVIQIFILLASLGIYTYGVREGTKVRNDRQSFSKFAHELIAINLTATIITYFVFFICLYFIDSFERYRTLLLINAISVGFTALGMDWVFGVYEDYLYITLRQIAIQIFTIIAMFIVVQDEKDIYIWAFLLVISNTGANIFNFFYARKYINYIPNKRCNYEIKKHMMPILVLFATQLATKVYINIDTVLLGMLSTDHHVGLYSAAVKLNTILITCLTAMTPVFVPRIVESIRSTDQVEFYNLVKNIFLIIISFALPAIVGIEMLGGELIRLLAGEAFIDATLTIRILSPIVLITSCANVVYYNILVPKDKEQVVFLCTVVGAGINIAISYIMIPLMQENGAAIGSLISEIISLLIALVICLRDDKSIKQAFPRIHNYLIGSIGICFWCFLVKTVFNQYYMVLIIGIVGSVMIYAIILLLLKDKVIMDIIFVINNIKCKITNR